MRFFSLPFFPRMLRRTLAQLVIQSHQRMQTTMTRRSFSTHSICLERKRGGYWASQRDDSNDDKSDKPTLPDKNEKDEQKKNDPKEQDKKEEERRKRPLDKSRALRTRRAIPNDKLKLLEGNFSNSANNKTPPSHFPKLLAIPLTKRPLFPGFYKSMYIKDPKAIEAVQFLWNSGQPYVGIFLAKDENSEQDLVTDIKDVERVGVFAQITNIYQSGPENAGLTVVVFPHRRVRITDISSPREIQSSLEQGEEVIVSTADTPVNNEEREIDYINSKLAEMGASLTNVENLVDEPYNPENRVIKATANEIINVLKEISQVNPLLRSPC